MNHMAIDQHGQTFHGLGKYPRKALLEILNRSHADKMYVDKISDPLKGQSVHIGYIISGLWLTIYEVNHWEKLET